MKLNWKFQGGRKVQNENKTSLGEVWIFSGTTKCTEMWYCHLKITININSLMKKELDTK